MKYVPKVIVLDFETALTSGEPSTEYYRDDFRAVSAAFAWRDKDGQIKTKYVEGEEAIHAFLEKIRDAGIPVAVHNYQFEYGVLFYRFAGLQSLVSYDTMRLAQVACNGGKLFAGTAVGPMTYDDLLDAAENGGDAAPYRAGLALVSCASRFLPEEWKEHKKPYHDWLRENAGVKRGQEGRNLHLLPADMFEAYNVADAIVTLLLFEAVLAKMAADGYDWTLDHKLYKSTAAMMAVAKGDGLPVDRAALTTYQSQIESELAQIERDFREKFKEPIEAIEAERVAAYIVGVKTERGQSNRRAECAEGTPEELRFNVGSNKQLAALFIERLGLVPKFWTKEPKPKAGKERKKAFVPSPSFKAAHLSTYGEGGTMLRQRRKRMLVLSQAKALLGLSRYDGTWHFNMKACGTATGRFAGGSQ